MEQEQSFAKINLSLDVLGKREDGYHDLAMVMQTVSLSDDVTLEMTEEKNVTVETNLAYLPKGEKNLAYKAACLFYEKLQIPFSGINIVIEKKIPVCAGLAGGSGDAAAVLRILNKLHESPFSLEELSKLAQKIGADVPYCLQGGTMLAEGTGEILTPLPPLPSCYFVLCKPNFSISTPELFQKIDSCRIKHRPNTKELVEAMERHDLSGIACRMFNVFEEALQPRQRKTVTEIKNVLIDFGALGASMSGSGPTVVGLFDGEEKAKKAIAQLKEEYPETFFTIPV